MTEFVSQALDNELRPREVQGMRTIAFQVPEDKSVRSDLSSYQYLK